MADHSHGGHRGRVKTRYHTAGLEAFAPHEIVELLLFFGIPQRDTNPLAHRLMDAFGSVSAILSADRELLLRVEGMTPNAATLITLVRDLQRYCATESTPLGMSLFTTEQRVNYLAPRFQGLATEEVWMVSMDVLSRVVGIHQVSKGTAMSADINGREILRYALADNAVKVIIAHNHPSGYALPSEPDIHTTAALARALDGAKIMLTDHLIFARDNDCVSFRETESIKPTLSGVDCSYT